MTVPRVLEEAEAVVEGATITYSYTWTGISSVSSPTATVYKDGQDITSTVMPSGSHSVSGNVQTLKPIVFQANHGGSKYVINIQAVADGNTDIYKQDILVLRPGDEG
jgi:hypothetical protein